MNTVGATLSSAGALAGNFLAGLHWKRRVPRPAPSKWSLSQTSI